MLCLLQPDPQDSLCEQLQRRPSTLPGRGEHAGAEALQVPPEPRALHPNPSNLPGNVRGTQGCDTPSPTEDRPAAPPPSLGVPTHLTGGVCPRHPLEQTQLLTRVRWSHPQSKVEITCPRSHKLLRVAFRTLLFLLRFLLVVKVKRKTKTQTKHI